MIDYILVIGSAVLGLVTLVAILTGDGGAATPRRERRSPQSRVRRLFAFKRD